MITEIHITPNPGNGWMDTALTVYRGTDAQGWVIPQTEMKLSDFPVGLLPSIGAAVGVLLAAAVADECVMERIILARQGDEVTFTNDDPPEEDTRTEVFTASCTEQHLTTGQRRTIQRHSRALDAAFGVGCLAAWDHLEKTE